MKILVQKQITVTIELNESEAQGLLDLLYKGTTEATVKALHLEELRKKLNENFFTSTDFKTVAEIY